MKFLKRSLQADVNPNLTRCRHKSMMPILMPLALAFTLFAIFGFATSGNAFASSTTACGYQDKGTTSTAYSYEGNNALANVTMQLDSCSGLARIKTTCILASDSIVMLINRFNHNGSFLNTVFSGTVTCAANQTVYSDAPAPYVVDGTTCGEVQIGDNYFLSDPLTRIGYVYPCI